MSLLNEIVKLLGSPTWGGIGVLVSTLLAVIALLRTRQSPSRPDPSQQGPLVPPIVALTPADRGTTSLSRTSVPSQKRRRGRRRGSNRWAAAYDYDDPTGGVPDEFLPPSYWN